MQTIEFDSYIENGVIAIPPQYQKIIPRSVRVIVLPKEETSGNLHDTVKRKSLYSLAIDMTGFIFNRDQINER
jgi:hypothetical protein